MKWLNDLTGDEKLVAWAIFWIAFVIVVCAVLLFAYNYAIVVNHYQPPLAK